MHKQNIFKKYLEKTSRPLIIYLIERQNLLIILGYYNSPPILENAIKCSSAIIFLQYVSNILGEEIEQG